MKAIVAWLGTLGVGFYVKLALISVLVVGSAYASWWTRGVFAEDEKKEAVDVATKDLTAKFKTEQDLRQVYQNLAESRFVDLMKAINGIQIRHVTIVQETGKEIASNPQFYNQQLPPGGYTQWLNAREMVNKAAAPPAISGQP